MKKLLTLFLILFAFAGASAQTEVWKKDAQTLAGTIRSVALKNQYRKLIGWNYSKQGSFYADSLHDYAVVYVYDNKSCSLPDLSVTKMSADSNVQPSHATNNQALVYQTASGVYLLMGPATKKTPYKVDVSCAGAVYVLWRKHK